MKAYAICYLSILLLASCGDSGPSLFNPVSTLRFADEEAGTVKVRGKDYKIIRSTGRDEKTGEVFVIEYRTKVNGRTVSCVGSIDRCPAAIISELDGDRDNDHH